MDDRLQRAAKLLENEFGSDWMAVAQMLGTEDLRRRVGKELTSFIAFPERGSGGNNQWRGNCSPEVVYSVAKYVLDTKKYYGKDIKDFTVLDPMSGSGTTKDAADRLGVKSILYDLNPQAPVGKGNWNALKNDVEDSADLIFFHPPYHDIIKYSGNMWGKPHPDDLSRCENYGDFIEKLNYVIKKLYMALRNDGRLAILVGDIRTKGNFYSIQHNIMRMGRFESFVVKAQFNCVSDSRRYSKPFIPIVTESMLIYQKDDPYVISFSKRIGNTVNISKKDVDVLTWHHLVRSTIEKMGGEARLTDLYDVLHEHPKSKKNEHYRERIRATIYEHKEQYIQTGNGSYRLTYEVA